MVEGRVGFVPQLVLGRLRLGAGGELGYGNVMRVAARPDDIAYWTFDLAIVASVDVVRFGERGAVFIAAEPSGGIRWGESVFAPRERHERLAAGGLRGRAFLRPDGRGSIT